MSDTSRDPFSPLVNDVRAGVIDALGESAVLSMFVTGSVAKQEAAVFDTGGSLEVYSDVDLAVVVGDGVDLRSGRLKMREVAAGLELARDHVLHCSRPDIGIYTRELYATQPVRPGTVGIPSSHQLVFGDPELPRSFDPAPDSIASDEALYLIENRMTELAEAVRPLHGDGASPSSIRAAHYNALKGGNDALTAVLITRGTYHPLRAKRTARFSAEADRELAGTMGEEAMTWALGCAAALDELQQSIRSELSDVLAAAGQTAAALVKTWCAIAAHEFGHDVTAVEDLFLRRCEAGRATGHLRQAMLLSRRIGYRRATLIRGSITKRAWVIADLLPIAALRIASTLEAQVAGESDPAHAHTRVYRYIDALTRAFGYRDGTVYERARSMYKDAIR